MEPATFAQLGDVFNNLVSAILGFAGITLFILLVLGGFKFITSGGDPKAIEGARNTLTYAIIGLVVLLLSYLVLVLIKQITGAPVTEFNLTI
jgi:hypothetical protein